MTKQAENTIKDRLAIPGFQDYTIKETVMFEDVCMQKVSGSEWQKRTCRGKFLPFAAHPSSSCFGSENRAIQIPV
jgi:hypothetical protein